MRPTLANCGLIRVAREWYGEDGPDEAELVERAEESPERAIATAAAEDSTRSPSPSATHSSGWRPRA